MKCIKLKWKKKYLSDKSGFWYEAKVSPIDWSYVVERAYKTDTFICYLFVNTFADEVKISKKKFKFSENAKEECEIHLTKVYKQFRKFILENNSN